MFGQKYGHLSILCKQMDIVIENFDIVRKVTSMQHFGQNPVLVHVAYIPMYALSKHKHNPRLESSPI